MSSPAASAAPQTGAHLIAAALHSLGVSVVFGIVGIPVIEVAEACLALGIRVICFRNEQAASYAASAYGYLTGRPGVCLVVGGPGVLHALAGVGNSAANATFPLLLLAGAAESTAAPTRGAFQQLDAPALLQTHGVKLAVRPAAAAALPAALRDAYRAAFYGRPGPAYVDLPADFIQAALGGAAPALPPPVPAPPRAPAPADRVHALAAALRAARAPLLIVGKGAAYARAEAPLRALVDAARLPFLPTPQAKGVLPDGHGALDVSAARSAALAGADAVVLLGARLNWILHFGERFGARCRVAQVDVCAEELGRHGADPALAVAGDVGVVVAQLAEALRGWRHDEHSAWRRELAAKMAANEKKARAAEEAATRPGERLGYQRVFALLQREFLRRAAADALVYVSEGANTMDISRSIFRIAAPRQRLDAGTYATMGVGLGYAIAAHVHYAPAGKRVVAIEGDSAVGFSLAELETMSRYRMGIIVVVMNNGGVYHGETDEAAEWERDERRESGTLPSTSLGFETRYDRVCEGLGGRGWRVESEEELVKAVGEAWAYTQGPSLINVAIRSGKGGKVSFNWQKSGKAKL